MVDYILVFLINNTNEILPNIYMYKMKLMRTNQCKELLPIIFRIQNRSMDNENEYHKNWIVNQVKITLASLTNENGY